MDIKHVLSCNPLRPAYGAAAVAGAGAAADRGWIEHDGGIVEIGHAGDGFAFDNEGPRHEALLQPHRVADGARHERRLAGVHRRRRLRAGPSCGCPTAGPPSSSTAGRRPSTGSATATSGTVFDLGGLAPGRPGRAGRPRQLVRGRRLRPVGRRPAADRGRVGDRRAGRRTTRRRRLVRRRRGSGRRARTTPTPGSGPSAGAVGEYNGKFMVNQQVLRGSARVTPPGHARRTYRNFFPAHARWAYAGVRLAE